ncbi:MAG: hypothetical protein NZ700_00510 [Gemmataceae bacterium]|nr:hypothetical protein [Gemmataceae bacterium]MDW8264497.1 hypothetical protein [Gemmataceae bacterium]
MKPTLSVLLCVVALACAVRGGAQTEPVDINQEFYVTPAAGPWLICAASFTGPNSAALAHDLVVELRQKYRLPAYVFNRSNEERRKQREEIEAKRRQQEEFFLKAGLDPATAASMVRVRTTRIEDQYAVLVGGYKDMDTARKALDDIRKLKPSQKFMGSVVQGTQKTGQVSERTWLNPFATAFVVHNPTVPMPPPDNKPDPLLKQLNADEPYSLLKCRKPWTLVVKDFPGASVIVPANTPPGSFLERIGLSRKSSEVLNAGALQAQQLAKALREMKEMQFEAYVLHTRHNSLVTVGGFDSPNDPKMQETIRKLASFRFTGPPDLTNPQGGPGLLSLWPQPLPMEVPRP